jgi:uncharacterized damage-inducible protein DinB
MVGYFYASYDRAMVSGTHEIALVRDHPSGYSGEMPSSTGTLPEDNRPQPTDGSAERDTLESFLDLNRATVIYKATGLSDEDAAKRVLPSLTTVSGLIRHLADVERSWFRDDLAGEANVPTRWSDDDRDGEFRVTADDSLADIIADYELACEESRRVSATFELADRGRSNNAVTLRWILVHMIEETARHCGHIDVLREMLDGATGE